MPEIASNDIKEVKAGVEAAQSFYSVHLLQQLLIRSLGDFFQSRGEKPQESKYQTVLESVSLFPLKVLRGEKFHRFPINIVAGAEVVKCRSSTGEEMAVRLTDNRVIRKLLEREKRIVEAVVGKRYDSKTGWKFSFPASIESFTHQNVYGLVMPYYEGDEGEVLTMEYSDGDLIDIVLTVIQGLQLLGENLEPGQIKVLTDNLKSVKRQYSIGRKVAYLSLLNSGYAKKISIRNLYRLQKKEEEMAEDLPSRLVHHDLHTFNIIPNLKKRAINIIDLSSLGYGNSVCDIGRVLIFCLISGREKAVRELEEKFVQERIITEEELSAAKAGALLDWGIFLMRMKPDTDELHVRLDRGRAIWKQEVENLQRL